MKYYYGNSYKEALSNNPIEINDIETLKNYEETYNFLIPVEDDDEKWAIVYMLKGTNIEETEVYSDFEDARSDYIHLVENEFENYKYIVLQHIYYDCEEEKIDEIDSKFEEE